MNSAVVTIVTTTHSFILINNEFIMVIKALLSQIFQQVPCVTENPSPRPVAQGPLDSFVSYETIPGNLFHQQGGHNT